MGLLGSELRAIIKMMPVEVCLVVSRCKKKKKKFPVKRYSTLNLIYHNVYFVVCIEASIHSFLRYPQCCPTRGFSHRVTST